MDGLLPRVVFVGVLLASSITVAAVAETLATGDAPFGEPTVGDVQPLRVTDAHGHHDGGRFTAVSLTITRGLTDLAVDVHGLDLDVVRDADGSLAQGVLNENDVARATLQVDWDGAAPLTLAIDLADDRSIPVTVAANGVSGNAIQPLEVR